MKEKRRGEGRKEGGEEVRELSKRRVEGRLEGKERRREKMMEQKAEVISVAFER